MVKAPHTLTVRMDEIFPLVPLHKVNADRMDIDETGSFLAKRNDTKNLRVGYRIGISNLMSSDAFRSMLTFIEQKAKEEDFDALSVMSRWKEFNEGVST